MFGALLGLALTGIDFRLTCAVAAGIFAVLSGLQLRALLQRRSGDPADRESSVALSAGQPLVRALLDRDDWQLRCRWSPGRCLVVGLGLMAAAFLPPLVTATVAADSTTLTTHIFRVEGMHCGSCALLIDDCLQDLPGVRGTQTRVTAGLSTVELDLTRSRPEDVVSAVEEFGYRASPLPLS